MEKPQNQGNKFVMTGLRSINGSKGHESVVLPYSSSSIGNDHIQNFQNDLNTILLNKTVLEHKK